MHTILRNDDFVEMNSRIVNVNGSGPHSARRKIVRSRILDKP